MTGELRPSDFRAFFHELHGLEPFPWQERLSALVCAGDWPGALDLPAASGKTACLDIAVFAMAVKRTGPRRVFFVVDRRLAVNAAFERMKKLSCQLREAKDGVLKVVASRLSEMAQGKSPLGAFQMRGSIYRDEPWVSGPLQPALIASCVDQIGSRLLFRGYGVGDNTLPIHASMVANDSLILLDEAHCSRPFSNTLQAVQEYRRWAGTGVETPFAFVAMTATPGRNPGSPFQLDADDDIHAELHKRLYAPKPAKLIVSKARAQDFAKFAGDLAQEAVQLAKMPAVRRIAVIVNRVKTARLVYKLLESRHRAHLLTGRMRPVDRSPLPAELEAMLSGRPRVADGEPVFVVATQCLEVGADLDFDAVVTECASIDALVQRFGRLDRVGDLGASGVAARGRILIPSPMTDEKYIDPVYGSALARTWNWLKAAGSEVDFGNCSEDGKSTVRERLSAAGEAAAGTRREDRRAPALLPAHLDLLVQTSPRPVLEPDVHLYLHGIEGKGSPEVQVVWRADLNDGNAGQWAEIVALCPPVSAEAMPVPLSEFRGWLAGSDESADSSDLEGSDQETESSEIDIRTRVLHWNGPESREVRTPRDILPGDTLVLAAASEGWDELGHVPRDGDPDAAERARWMIRRPGWVLRLHPGLIKAWPENEARVQLLESVTDMAADEETLTASLRAYRDQLDQTAPAWLRETLAAMPAEIEAEAYPGESHQGWVLSQRVRESGSGRDESSTGQPVWLDKHLQDVTREVDQMASALIVDESLRANLSRAAQRHDFGKADPRFQALLWGGDTLAAQFAPRLLAKRAGKARRQGSELPQGFHHELVSLLLVAQDASVMQNDMALHLIASHQGRCRPFAPAMEAAGADLSYGGCLITAQQRVEQAAHRLDSGVADRFWRLTRSYGWWGLAYVESLMRLADWKAGSEDTV